MRALLLAAILCAVRMPCPASAQSGSVTGVVVGADSQPVPLAYVGIVGTTLSTTASSTGQFVLVSVPTGRRLLDVRRLGYTPLQLPIDVRSADTLHLQVRLLPVAFELDTVAVANEGSAALRAFEERRARGPGVFFTRDEIERMQPRQVTDVLRRVPGIQVRPVNGTYGDNVFVTMRGSRCSMMFYVNGSPLPTAQDVPINNYIAVEEVVAVEVYAPSEMPPQFNSTRFNARCGLVGIWTRSGR